jgi:hypothetical protein
MAVVIETMSLENMFELVPEIIPDVTEMIRLPSRIEADLHQREV